MSKIILYNGDAYEDIKLIPDKSIDLIYVDIPYELVEGGSSGSFGSDKRSYHSEVLNCAINTSNSDDILQSIKNKLSGKTTKIKNETGIDYSILNEFVRVLKKIYCYIWCSKEQIPSLIDYFVNKRQCMYDILTWHKTNPIPTCNGRYLSDTEYCLLFREKGTEIYGDYETKNKFFVSSVNKKDKNLYNHPTIKPLEFVKNHILNSTKEGGIVLDCFMGSGTTGVACKELNRNFIGIELDKKYFETAKERIENYKNSSKEDSRILTIFDFLGED